MLKRHAHAYSMNRDWTLENRPVAWRAISFALIVAAVVAVASTARVFSATFDEPAHLAAGIEWLTSGHYTWDLQHPPLGRIAIAIGPYLGGARTQGGWWVYDEGARLLGTGRHYVETLASARHGVLPFFVLLALVVWAWAKRLSGEVGAVVGTLLLVTNPNVLAHAGLATTDVACASTTLLALLMAVRWVEQPGWVRALAFGGAMGLAIGSRLSAIAFIGAALLTCYVVRLWATRDWTLNPERRVSRSLAHLLAAAAAGSFVIAAVYRFHLHPFFQGVEFFARHGSAGHPSYLFGTPGTGWWYYFPVALLVKTPLPLLLAGIVGSSVVVRRLRSERDWAGAAPLASAVAVLLLSMTVKVDIGVRLVLPIYPLLAIVGAQGMVGLWRESQPARSLATRTGIGALLLCSLVIAVRSYPDNLSYFNLLAGDHPERILVDSNLDWGQDLYRLRDSVIARGIRDSVHIASFGAIDPSAAGVPNSRELEPGERVRGWVAVSETYLAGEWAGHTYQWVLAYPEVIRIGPGMRMWYIPPRAATLPPSTSPAR